MVSLAMAIASRGVSNNKVDLITKKLRVLSCFGHENIPPCQNLKKSKSGEFFYCGSCGCGDSKNTWLLKNSNEYSKLDYPKLNCPIEMPGFSNYNPNNTAGIGRRKKIESMDPQELELIQVTIGKSEEYERIMNEVNKIIKNS